MQTSASTFIRFDIDEEVPVFVVLGALPPGGMPSLLLAFLDEMNEWERVDGSGELAAGFLVWLGTQGHRLARRIAQAAPQEPGHGPTFYSFEPPAEGAIEIVIQGGEPTPGPALRLVKGGRA